MRGCSEAEADSGEAKGFQEQSNCLVTVLALTVVEGEWDLSLIQFLPVPPLVLTPLWTETTASALAELVL